MSRLVSLALKKKFFFSLLFVIIVLSVIPHTSRFVLPYKSPWMASGYIQHALGYLLLSAVACHAFPKRRTWACLSGILCLGIGLELIQYKYPCICFLVFHRDMPLIFMDFILRNIYSGTYNPHPHL